jgi:hypothetical protein
MVLEEGWAKGWEVSEFEAMHFQLQTFWVVEEQGEDHASRCHLMIQYSVGSSVQHWLRRGAVVAEPLQLFPSSLLLQLQLPCSAPSSS